MINYIEQNNIKIGIVSGISVRTAADALDLMADAFQNKCSRIIIPKEAFSQDFFDLKTKLAGEILQKFSNYGSKLAIVGDFDNISSKSLAAFIRECNRGSLIFFKKTAQEAVLALSGV